MNTLEVTVATHTTDITNLVDSDVSIELRLLDLEQAVNGIRFDFKCHLGKKQNWVEEMYLSSRQGLVDR